MPNRPRFLQRHAYLSEPLASLPYLAKWCLLAALVAVLSGSASALFLIALAHVTGWREHHHWIVWFLPLAGLGVGLLYARYGKAVEGGNNLLIDEIHDPKRVVALRMAPLVMGATLVSHFFGASVGREGTAVQMGGALADQLTTVFKLRPADRRILLMSGMSAGFASVFGTPLAGTVFGLEVLAIGRMRYDALLPCLVAALVADHVSRAWGADHTHYIVSQVSPFGLYVAVAVGVAGAVFGVMNCLASTSRRWPQSAASLLTCFQVMQAFTAHSVSVPVNIDIIASPGPQYGGLPTSSRPTR